MFEWEAEKEREKSPDIGVSVSHCDVCARAICEPLASDALCAIRLQSILSPNVQPRDPPWFFFSQKTLQNFFGLGNFLFRFSNCSFRSPTPSAAHTNKVQVWLSNCFRWISLSPLRISSRRLLARYTLKIDSDSFGPLLCSPIKALGNLLWFCLAGPYN